MTVIYTMKIKTPHIFIPVILGAFICSGWPQIPAGAQDFRLPVPGVRVYLSPPLEPPVLRGVKINANNPFSFEFILNNGDPQGVGNLKPEATKLIKYFLASLTIPEQDLWVNLSPYEKDRIIPPAFGMTEMGRDLLAEDYMLKQITATLIYPEEGTGRKFWKRIYQEASKKFGTTDIAVNTFNKVWVVPERAVVFENAPSATAYIVDSRLKVMLEQDYLALDKYRRQPGDMFLTEQQGTCPQAGCQPERGLTMKATQGNDRTDDQSRINSLGSKIVREIVIPELTREVNEDKNFAQLRQVYSSLILATWYKKKVKNSILAQVYSDKNKVIGVNVNDPKEKERIYQRYLQAFKKGVFNYIKDEQDPVTQEAFPRKYFSGGAKFDMAMMTVTHDPTTVAGLKNNNFSLVNADLALASGDAAMVGDGMKERYDRELAGRLGVEWEFLSQGEKDLYGAIGIDHLIEMANAAGPNAQALLRYGLLSIRRILKSSDDWKSFINGLHALGNDAVKPNAKYLFKDGITAVSGYVTTPGELLTYLQHMSPLLDFMDGGQAAMFFDFSVRLKIAKSVLGLSGGINDRYAFAAYVLGFPLTQSEKNKLLVYFLEPYVLAHPEELTVDILENLANRYGSAPLKYLLYYVLNNNLAPQQVRQWAGSYIQQRQLFGLHPVIQANLKEGAKKVLVVHNIQEGRGDELIRMAALLQGLLDYNEGISITLVTNRPSFYNHDRVTTVPFNGIDNAGQWAGFKEQYDVVIDFYDGSKAHNKDFERALMASGVSGRAFVDIRSKPAGENFIYGKVSIGAQDYVDRLHLGSIRSENVYETGYRLVSELGLPLRMGEDAGRPGSLITGRSFAPAEQRWKSIMREMDNELPDGRLKNPVDLLEPYGWESEIKGIGRNEADRQKLINWLENKVQKGYKVLLLPNGRPWGTKEIALSFINTLPGDIREHIRQAVYILDEPAEDDKLLKYFVKFSDDVSTAEGGMEHLAFNMGKPFEIVPFGTLPVEYVPQARSPRQRLQQNVDSAQTTAVSLQRSPFSEMLTDADWKALTNVLGIKRNAIRGALKYPPRTKGFSLGFSRDVEDLDIDQFELVQKDFTERLKKLENTKQITIYQIGLGLEGYLETEQIFKALVEAFRHAGIPRSAQNEWSVHFIAVDVNQEAVNRFLQEFKINVPFRLQLNGVAADTLDRDAIRRLENNKADYIFHRNTTYANKWTSKGLFRMFDLTSDTLPSLPQVLNAYVSIRNVLEYLAIPGTRYITELAVKHPKSHPLYLPGADIVKVSDYGVKRVFDLEMDDSGTGIYHVNDPLGLVKTGVTGIISDYAMTPMKAPGGIDLNAVVKELQVRNSGGPIKFDVDPALLKQLQGAAGFVPVVTNIQPMPNLKVFLGISDSQSPTAP